MLVGKTRRGLMRQSRSRGRRRYRLQSTRECEHGTGWQSVTQSTLPRTSRSSSLPEPPHKPPGRLLASLGGIVRPREAPWFVEARRRRFEGATDVYRRLTALQASTGTCVHARRRSLEDTIRRSALFDARSGRRNVQRIRTCRTRIASARHGKARRRSMVTLFRSDVRAVELRQSTECQQKQKRDGLFHES